METRTAAVYNSKWRILTSVNSRQRSAISFRPLHERTDFGPAVCTYAPPSLTMAFTPQCSPATSRCF